MKLAIISPYRKRDQTVTPSAEYSALNFVTEALAQHLSLDGVDVRVVAPSLEKHVGQPWHDGPVVVEEVSQCRGLLGFLRLLHGVPQSHRVVHFEHEVYAYGGLGPAFTMPLALRLLRRRGHAIVTTLHGIIPLESIDRRFMASYRVPGSPWLVRRIWKALIRGICNASAVVHVHEPTFRKILIEQYGVHGTIVVIPLGIDGRRQLIAKADARTALNLEPDGDVACFFGFLFKRKGIGELLKSARALVGSNPRLTLLVAGDLPARAGDAAEVRALIDELADCPRVVFTGFVSDDRVPLVMAASDVMILPYTFSMSASGPLTLGAAYNLPLLLSDRFASQFPEGPGLFEPTSDGIRMAIERFFANRRERDRAQDFSSALMHERSWQRVTQELRVVYESLEKTCKSQR